MDHGSFKIDQLIMHSVPGGHLRASTTIDIVNSDIPIALDRSAQGYLESRIREMLTTHARPVVEDATIKCDAPRLIKEMLQGRGDLVIDSQEVAKTLYKVQAHSAPEGLLLFILGTLKNRPCCVVAKIEREEGIKLELVTDANNKVTFSTQYLRDLIFGQGTEVYKIGAFHEIAKDGRLTGHVADAQQRNRGVATYFLEEVLGCRFLESSDVATERFFVGIQKYIGKLDDPIKAAKYEVALLSEMQSQRVNLSIEAFSRSYLDKEDREEFHRVLEDEGVDGAPFTKEVALIKSLIVRVKIQTARNASIFVPPDMYADGSLTVTKSEISDTSQILITDRVTSFAGASGRSLKKEESKAEKKATTT